MANYNNIIVINRGDTYEFSLDIIDESAESGLYTLQGDDAVYMGIMDPHQLFEDALVKKKFTAEDLEEEGNLNIVIYPEDTLDLIPGKYYYSVKLKLDHYDEYNEHIEKVQTVIDNAKFVICD